MLLEANGFSSDDEDLQSRLSQITQLEMFLQDYPKVLCPRTWAYPARYTCTVLTSTALFVCWLQMVALSYFSALTDLRLIDQVCDQLRQQYQTSRVAKHCDHAN